MVEEGAGGAPADAAAAAAVDAGAEADDAVRLLLLVKLPVPLTAADDAAPAAVVVVPRGLTSSLMVSVQMFCSLEK